jgi:hypothetical protein
MTEGQPTPDQSVAERRLPAPRTAEATITGLGALLSGTVGELLLRERETTTNAALLQVAGAFFVLLAMGLSPRPLAWLWSAGANAVTRAWPGWLPAPRRFRRLPHALGLATATVLLSLWFKDLAFTHDHSEHCFKAYHFWHEMLGRGRLKGWTHFLAFGYPSGELTPFGPELWVAMFRAATLGLLSWTYTYALAFAGVVVFAIATVYLFARRFFGRVAALVAAVLWTLDPGSWYQGGWLWLEWLGVWPVTLALGFALLALIALADLLDADSDRQRRRAFLRAAAWMLASLVTHQVPIVAYAVALPALLVAGWLRQGRQARLSSLVAAVALGLGLAAFYLVPMFARSDLTQDLGVRGFSVEDLAHRLVEMRIFENGWGPTVAIGLLGLVAVVRDRNAFGLFFAFCASAFVLLSSDILVAVFHVERLLPGILKIECQRMLLVAKLFWFPLAGYAVSNAAAGRPIRQASSTLRHLGTIAILCALGAPLLVPATKHLYRLHTEEKIEQIKQFSSRQDFEQFFAWSDAERRGSSEPYRIAYALRDKHDHAIAIAPIFNRTYGYKVGYTSAQQFSNFPMADDPPLLAALSVKYLLTDYDHGGPNFALERMFGPLRLYRFVPYRAWQPFTLTGPGRAELAEFSPEKIRVRLDGTTQDSRLKLHVATFPRWRAHLDGRQVDISPATVSGLDYPLLMEVPTGGHELVFRYGRRLADWLGLLMTLASLCVFFIVAVGRERWLGRLKPAVRFLDSPMAARSLPWLAGLGGLAVLGVAAWKTTVPTPLPRTHVLAESTPADEISLGGATCVRSAPTVWRCGAHELRQDVVSGSYGSHVCLTVPAVGPLTISVRRKLGHYLLTSYDPEDTKSGHIRYFIDGVLEGDTSTRREDQGVVFLQIDTRSRANTEATLRIEMEAAPLHCFDIRILERD